MFLLSATFWSIMRVFIAYCISLLIGILYGIFSATNLHRERWMLPLLDILQSVPILGFFPVAVTILVVLFHGQRIGLELAAIFLIVTSQLWNIAFGVYETIKTFPKDLLEMTQSFGMNVTFTVEHIYLPALVPTIIYNSGVSIAVGWYFLMASEIITLGNVEVQLPGLGTAMMAYVSQGNLLGTFGVIGMIVLVNFITQWFIFRPLIEWSDLFKFGAVGSAPEEPRLVTILRNSIPWQKISEWINRLIQLGRRFQKSPVFSRVSHYLTFSALAGLFGYFLYWMLKPPYPDIIREIPKSLFFTTLRVVGAVFLSVILSFPFVVKATQTPRNVKNIYLTAAILGSIPAVIFYPLIVRGLGRENMELAAIILLLTGSFWYTLFNMLKGALMLPTTLVEMAHIFDIRGWWYYKTILIPSMLPSLITGAITAWGGAWNTSMVAEKVTFGQESFSLPGIGSLLIAATAQTKHLLWVVLVMTLWIALINTFFWKKWYRYTSEKYNFTE